MASESEDYEYYAYSSDEDGYQLEGDEDANESMEWETDNPNAPPMNYVKSKWKCRVYLTGELR